MLLKICLFACFLFSYGYAKPRIRRQSYNRGYQPQNYPAYSNYGQQLPNYGYYENQDQQWANYWNYVNSYQNYQQSYANWPNQMDYQQQFHQQNTQFTPNTPATYNPYNQQAKAGIYSQPEPSQLPKTTYNSQPKSQPNAYLPRPRNPYVRPESTPKNSYFRPAPPIVEKPRNAYIRPQIPPSLPTNPPISSQIIDIPYEKPKQSPVSEGLVYPVDSMQNPISTGPSTSFQPSNQPQYPQVEWKNSNLPGSDRFDKRPSDNEPIVENLPIIGQNEWQPNKGVGSIEPPQITSHRSEIQWNPGNSPTNLPQPPQNPPQLPPNQPQIPQNPPEFPPIPPQIPPSPPQIPLNPTQTPLNPTQISPNPPQLPPNPPELPSNPPQTPSGPSQFPSNPPQFVPNFQNQPPPISDQVQQDSAHEVEQTEVSPSSHVIGARSQVQPQQMKPSEDPTLLLVPIPTGPSKPRGWPGFQTPLVEERIEPIAPPVQPLPPIPINPPSIMGMQRPADPEPAPLPPSPPVPIG